MKPVYSAANTSERSNPRQKIKTISLWINAFIPRTIPDQTVIVQEGDHTGKTAYTVPVPTILGYLTDQREFSADPAASSRMHSELQLDVIEPRILKEIHRCDPTTEISARNGEISCETCADTSDMKFESLEVSENGHVLTLNIKASARNSCIKVANLNVSPRLDFSGTITIRLNETGDKALVWFRGLIEPYPAFEMYACANDNAPETVFTMGIAPHATVLNLVGAPGREVYGEVELVG